MLAAALLVLPGTLGIVTWDESSHPCNGGFHDAGPGGSAITAAMSYDALWSVPKAVACLESMPLDAAIRDAVVSNIQRGIGSVYAYADMVHDSSQHVSSLDQCYDFDVHHVSFPDYDDVIDRLKAETSFGKFWFEIVRMSNRLQDAHTSISAPFAYAATVRRVPARVLPTRQEGRVRSVRRSQGGQAAQPALRVAA